MELIICIKLTNYIDNIYIIEISSDIKPKIINYVDLKII